MVLRDVAVVNTCAADVLRSYGLRRVSQGLLGLLSTTAVVRMLEYQNVTLVSRPAELAQMLYTMQMQRPGMQLWPSGAFEARHRGRGSMPAAAWRSVAAVWRSASAAVHPRAVQGRDAQGQRHTFWDRTGTQHT